MKQVVKINLIYIIVALVVIPLTSATPLIQYNLGENVTLLQSCSCNSVIISTIVYTENGQVIITNQSMTKNQNNFNLTLNSNNFTQLGLYKVIGYNEEGKTFNYEILIKNGGAFGWDLGSTLQIFLFSLVLVIALILFLLGSYVFSGILISILGFVLLSNGIKWYISVLFIIIGLFILNRGYKTS